MSGTPCRTDPKFDNQLRRKRLNEPEEETLVDGGRVEVE
jgi:hypothetical protein